MSAEAKRLYVVGGSKKVQETQLSCFFRNGLKVVQIDSPSDPPLRGYKNAQTNKAQFAVVNIGRHEIIDGGLIGEDIVDSLIRTIPRLNVITFSLDAPSEAVPGIYAHVQRTFQIGSYIKLADVISEAPPKEITIFPNPRYL